VVLHAYNSNTREAEAGDLKLETSLGYIVSLRTAWSYIARPYIKKLNKEK
jgi:hypothetical protein